MKQIVGRILMVLCLVLLVVPAEAQSRKGRVSNAKKTSVQKTPKIVGKHMLSLQWLSWKKFGSCTIDPADENGEYAIYGMQRGGDEPQNEDDYLRIDGVITFTDPYHLKFNGTIRTKVYHINGGNEVIREGEYDFVRKENRKYWRLQQEQNPVDGCYDYVDIYF